MTAIKKLLTKWQLWATLFALLVGLIIYVFYFAPTDQYATIEVPRRDFMTVTEYNNITEGMTFEALQKVQEAKPMHEVEPIGDGLFLVEYKGEKDGSVIRIYLEETEPNKYIVRKKEQEGLLGN